MRNFLLGLSLSVAFIVGCVAGQAAQSTANAQAPAATPAGAQDQYRCFYPKGGLASLRLSESINEVAAQGYELVTVTQAPSDDYRSAQGLVICMRRR